MREANERHYLLTAVAIIAAVAGACATLNCRPPESGRSVEGRPAASPLQLTESNKGETIRLAVSERFRITLASNPTTGYSWQLAECDEKIVKMETHEFVAPESSEPVVGAGGHEQWEFVAQNPGTTKVRLEYRRPWEPKNNEPADTFEVTAEVGPSATQNKTE